MHNLLKNKNSEDIGKMFNDISHKYDFLNHFLSLGLDVYWRKKLIHELQKECPKTILDVATGTADLAIETAKKIPEAAITGIDIAEEMLNIGQKKINKKALQNRITLKPYSAESLPFDDNSFDSIMVSFGVRNFHNAVEGLKQMLRTLKPGHKIFILEFSKPKGIFKYLYTIYTKFYLPVVGFLVTGHKKAFRYLYKSIKQFPENEEFIELMQQAGIINISKKTLTMGIATLYTGEKAKKDITLQ